MSVFTELKLILETCYPARPEQNLRIALRLTNNGIPNVCAYGCSGRLAWHRLEATHPDARRQEYATAQALILGDVWFDKLRLLEIRAETIKENAASAGFADSF